MAEPDPRVSTAFGLPCPLLTVFLFLQKLTKCQEIFSEFLYHFMSLCIHDPQQLFSRRSQAILGRNDIPRITHF